MYMAMPVDPSDFDLREVDGWNSAHKEFLQVCVVGVNLESVLLHMVCMWES